MARGSSCAVAVCAQSVDKAMRMAHAAGMKPRAAVSRTIRLKQFGQTAIRGCGVAATLGDINQIPVCCEGRIDPFGHLVDPQCISSGPARRLAINDKCRRTSIAARRRQPAALCASPVRQSAELRPATMFLPRNFRVNGLIGNSSPGHSGPPGGKMDKSLQGVGGSLRTLHGWGGWR